MFDPIELLARDDKWQLGNGDALVFAPPLPLWLDTPGFWDEATVHQYAFAPLFTVTVLDAEGRELPARVQSRRWTPAELTVEYRLANGVTATEVRTAHPGGIFVSEWRLQALRETPLDLVAWTAQPPGAVEPGSLRFARGSLGFARVLRDGERPPLTVAAELTCLGGATSWGVHAGEWSASRPRWRATPFMERWRPGGFAAVAAARDAATIPAGAALYGAVHRAITVGSEGAAATFALRLSPDVPVVGKGWSASAVAQPTGTLGGASRRRWQELFGRVPSFRCSDPYLESYYWYRWYGLWLNGLAGGCGNFAHPALCAAPGADHALLAPLAPGQLRELRWLDDLALARGTLRALLAHQREDGSLPERVELLRVEGTAGAIDLGRALLALDAVARDDALLAELYPRVARYADWLAGAADADGTGLYDGAAPPCGAAAPQEPARRAKTVEATVYAYTLLRALERAAARAGHADDAARWRARADRTRDAVRQVMWDAPAGMFLDVDARQGTRLDVRAATGFLPYATDIATAEHLAGLERTLLDPDGFWTAFPVPSVACDEPAFTPFAGPAGEATPGRVRPELVSQLVEALARAAEAYAPHLRARVAQLLNRLVRMMFHDGDLRRPNSHRHYNPVTGHASVARGDDEQQRAWVNDLVIRFVMGIRPHDDGVTVDPFPFGLEQAEITGVCVRGRRIDVRIEGATFRVTTDGVAREGRLGAPIAIPL